jgi:secondary thiamine-phosphate synthase enzyme
MSFFHDTYTIQSETRVTFDDITNSAVESVKKSGIKNGLLNVYSQHTTCSVLIQEQSDDVNYWGTQFILQDMVIGLQKVFPNCDTEGQYLHPGPKHIQIAKQERNEEAGWSLNTEAHLRSVVLGRSVTVPIIDGEVQLGEFGRIYFCDFDRVRARKRTVRVTVLGD